MRRVFFRISTKKKNHPLAPCPAAVRAWVLLLLAVSLSAPASDPPGDWREPRGNRHLTGIQPLAGEMKEAPELLAKWSLGSSVPAITRVEPTEPNQPPLALAIVAGALHCFDTSGTCLWRSHPRGLNFTQINQVADLDGDGDREILLQAGRTADPFGAAVMVDLSSGDILWRYDVEPMSYAWYLHVGDYLQDGGAREIVVLMHGYPPDPKNGYIAMFAFCSGDPQPEQVWRYDFHEYTCFPTLLTVDWDLDGTDEICIETHSRMWLLNPKTGELEYFTGWDVSPANVRSYGHIEFNDFDSDGDPDFLCIATFAQHHEVLINSGTGFAKAWSQGWDSSVTTGKIATRYPTPPYGDVDGDGRQELVLSMFNGDREERWMLRVYDLLTGDIEGTYPEVIPGALGDMEGDGKMEISCNRCTDPTGQALSGALILAVSGGEPKSIWSDPDATLPSANHRKMRGKQAFLINRATGTAELVSSASGSLEEVSYSRPEGPPKTDFSAIPALDGGGFPTLLAADLTGDGKNELLVHRGEGVHVLSLGQGRLYEEIAVWDSTCPPALADLDGDGQIEAVTGQAGPTLAPSFQARNLSGGENLLWEKTLPPTDRTGLPQPRPLYLRSGRFLGRQAADVYAWIGTPVVRSGMLRGDNGDWMWDKGQIPDNERYWGPSVNFASAWDFDEDGAEDLVFTNPDYFCIASGASGELLAGPAFPPEIFKQTSQGLYTFPAILGREERVPLVALVGGHYFQGVMTLDREPLWHDQPPVGENRSGFEAFFQDEGGRWLLGLGRQNGEFACLDATTGETVWEIDTGATCSSPAVVDVDGDGLMEFVFGTSHGEILAVGVDSSDAPRKVWEKPLPSGAGDPIAADLDADGRCDLAVPLASGEVWVLGIPQE